ncbi:unnamed protein product [Brachionus calyciflorus]|uniref:Tetraspanin n=1 Tax=Brachionus calyciflorus TaxID=104777 RepID=A0A814IK52_9BILA|nr:unnamed protein product [Brachionus calyciflorus]
MLLDISRSQKNFDLTFKGDNNLVRSASLTDFILTSPNTANIMFYSDCTNVQKIVYYSALETSEFKYVPYMMIVSFITLIYILVLIISLVVKYEDFGGLVGFLAIVPIIYLLYYPIISWIYWAFCHVFYRITDDFFLKQNEIYSVKFNSFSQNKARIDKNQEYFECCGWEGPEDYYGINRNYSLIPKSCWKNTQKFESLSDIYSIGCKNKILPFLVTNSYYFENYFWYLMLTSSLIGSFIFFLFLNEEKIQHKNINDENTPILP